MADYGFIYITTNTINDNKYLGKCKISRKISPSYLGSGKLLKQAILKFGKDNFVREVISYANDADDLWSQEHFFLTYFDCIASSRWYNISWQNTRGFSEKTHSQETKEKMRLNHKRPVYDSTRVAFSESAKRNKTYLKAAAKRKELTGDKHHRSISVMVDGVRYGSICEAKKNTNYSYFKLRKLALTQCGRQ